MREESSYLRGALPWAQNLPIRGQVAVLDAAFLHEVEDPFELVVIPLGDLDLVHLALRGPGFSSTTLVFKCLHLMSDGRFPSIGPDPKDTR